MYPRTQSIINAKTYKNLAAILKRLLTDLFSDLRTMLKINKIHFSFSNNQKKAKLLCHVCDQSIVHKVYCLGTFL